MTSSSRIQKSLVIKPVHLICEDEVFIGRLVKIFMTHPRVIQLEKKAQRKARAIANKMGFALSACIEEKSIAPFKLFLGHLFPQLTKGKRHAVLQECRRHLNSSDVIFAAKAKTRHFLGVKFEYGEGELLSELNKQLDQAIQENDSAYQTQATQSAAQVSSGWGIKKVLFTLAGLLVKTANAQTCTMDQSPLTYSWQRQCPAAPPQTAFLTKAGAEFLHQHCLVYANYPLEYTQLFVWGHWHGINGIDKEPGTLHPNTQKIKWLIHNVINHNRPETVFFEGTDVSESDPSCGPPSSLIKCQGWDHIKIRDRLLEFYDQLKQVLIFKESCEKQKATLEAIRAPSFKQTNELKKINADYQLSLVFQKKLEKEFYEIMIKPRNKGVIQSVTNMFRENPDTRGFVIGGGLHFFTNTSMSSYKPSDEIAEVRDFFENLDAQGKPVALLYLRDDQTAENYKKNGYR